MTTNEPGVSACIIVICVCSIAGVAFLSNIAANARMCMNYLSILAGLAARVTQISATVVDADRKKREGRAARLTLLTPPEGGNSA